MKREISQCIFHPAKPDKVKTKGEKGDKVQQTRKKVNIIVPPLPPKGKTGEHVPQMPTTTSVTRFADDDFDKGGLLDTMRENLAKMGDLTPLEAPGATSRANESDYTHFENVDSDPQDDATPTEQLEEPPKDAATLPEPPEGA